MKTAEYHSPEASGLTRDAVYGLAASVGSQLKFLPGGDLDPIVEKLGGRIRYQNFWELESTGSGSIRVHDEGDFDIFLAAHTGPLRDRFTIAHELGHYILHFLYPLKCGKAVGRIQAKRFGSGRVEWEANWFAAGFLMPANEFTKIFRKKNGDIISIASAFGVSIAAAEVRVNSLQLTE